MREPIHGAPCSARWRSTLPDRTLRIPCVHFITELFTVVTKRRRSDVPAGMPGDAPIPLDLGAGRQTPRILLNSTNGGTKKVSPRKFRLKTPHLSRIQVTFIQVHAGSIVAMNGPRFLMCTARAHEALRPSLLYQEGMTIFYRVKPFLPFEDRHGQIGPPLHRGVD